MPVFETPLYIIGLAGLIGYVLGSIAFGVVAAKVFRLGNLRNIGSGNIGATNVLRTGNKRAAALTLLLDAGKGAAAVGIGFWMGGADAAQAAGLAAFLGHLFPVFLAFKGGKGVATYLGVVLGLAWPVGLAACATWACAALLTRYSSASALAAAALAPLWAWAWRAHDLYLLLVVLAVLVFWTHRANIARLIRRTEPKIGQKG